MISRVWEATTAKRMQIDPYCQQRKCSLVNVVSSTKGYADIRRGSGEMGPQKGRVGQKSDFLTFVQQYLENQSYY